MPLALAAAAALAAAPAPPEDAAEDVLTSSAEAPLLPRRLSARPTTYGVVGVGVERFGSNFTGSDQFDNQLVGLTGMWRISAFGPHALLMTKPAVEHFRDSRFLVGLGLRGFYRVRGFTELSYGVGSHFEARLEDHYWLAYVTPLELGATIWDKGSWNIELFVGARRAVGGSLINHYLIDPNGFNDAEAREELDRARHERPWKGFVRVVFARRID